MSKEVTIKFSNDDAAHHFLIWLCESGEQQYWQWMECREQEESGDITAVDFDYHGGTLKGEEFGKHPIIATCGRLDDK